MLKFNAFLSVVICARSVNGLERWTKLFGRLVENFSLAEGVGGWVGEKVVETENNRVITVWGPEWPLVKRVLRLARRLQQVEKQEAISIIWSTPGTGWQARIVFDSPDDWGDLDREARCAFRAPKEEDPSAEGLRKVFPEMKGIWFD